MGQQRKHKLYTFKRKHKWYIYTRGYEQPCYEWFCQTKEAENGFEHIGAYELEFSCKDDADNNEYASYFPKPEEQNGNTED